MNYKLTLAQPVFYYGKVTKDIKPNLRRSPVLLEEIEVLADEIDVLCEVKNMYPFTTLIKAVETEVSGYTVYGYYLVGEFDLKKLKKAIDTRLLNKRMKHFVFSDIAICDKMEKICLSYNDTHVLVEWGTGTKLIPRKPKEI